MDAVRNVLVQLGDPLAFDLVGDGALVSTDARGNLLLGASTNSTQRCCASQVLRGSWMLRVDVVSVTSSLFTNYAFGVIPVQPRQTLHQRRLVNAERPQDWGPTATELAGVVLDRAGNVWTAGGIVSAMSPSGAGDAVYVIYSDADKTLTFRRNAPDSGDEVQVSNLEGPFRFIANAAFTAVSLRIVHDVARLPRIAGIRPAGVWGRLATIGTMDPAADVVWDGRIEDGGDPTFEITASFAVMGRRGRTRSIGDITAVNTPDWPGADERALDDWLTWHARDQPITILRGVYGQPLSSYAVVARGAVDSVSEPREGQIAIACRDQSVLLDVPWQAETYPDSTPATNLRGRSKPTVTGLTVRAAGLVMTDPANLLYDIGDDVAFVSQVYDQGVALTAGVGYSVNTDGRGIKRLTNPVGLQCATVEAGLIESAVCIGATIGDFVQWSGTPTTPRGWTNPTTGTGTSVTSVAGGARFVRGSTGQADLLAANVLGSTAGVLRIDIDISAHASGSLVLRAETSTGTATTLATISTVGVTGPRTIMASLPASRPYLRLRVAAAGDITVRSIRVARVATVETAAQHIRYAACYRGQLSPSDIHSSVASFPATSPLCLATGVDDRRTVLAVLDDITASVGAAWWFDRTGKLKVGALSVPGKSPVLVLDDGNIEGDITRSLDEASGLSTRVAADPTWTPHGDADIAGSLNTTDAGRQLAANLKAEHAVITTGAYRVAPEYAFAVSAAPINTLLSNAAGAGLLANSYTGIYSVPRYIWRCAANLDDALSLNPLDNVELVLDAGSVRARVLSIAGRYASDTVQLTLWG